MNHLTINIASYAMACIGQDGSTLKQVGIDSCLNFSDHSKNLLKNVPVMQKRRLDTLGKSVLAVYYSACNQAERPLVFSSNHGNIHQTYDLLTNMIENDEISPTAFSLSVHNALAGVMSIIDGNKNEIIALAPGNGGVLPAFAEAMTIFNRGHEVNDVGVIFYDTPLPKFYHDQAESAPEYSIFAACQLVRQDAEDKKLSVDFDRLDHATQSENHNENQKVESFFESLLTQQSHTFTTFNTHWQCSIS